jgi:hypothetical protein
MVGNAAFGKGRQTPIHRFESGADIVPLLPPDPSLWASVAEAFERGANTARSGLAWFSNKLFGTKYDVGHKFASDRKAYRPVGVRHEIYGEKLLTDGGVAWKQTLLDVFRAGRSWLETISNVDLMRFLKDHQMKAYNERMVAIR